MRVKIFLTFVFIICLNFNSAAQVSPAPVPIDDEFDLNIPERHITESGYRATTAVDLQNGELRLSAGVSLSAAAIDVTLRGVAGHVRFRASLDDLLRRMPRLTRLIDSR